MGNKALFAGLLCIALLSLAPRVNAGDHCIYTNETYGVNPDLNFGDPGTYKVITDRVVGGEPRPTYDVPEGTKLIVQGINNSFVVHCVNGATGHILPPVRLMEIKPDGTKVEAAGNYSYGGEACGGGSVVSGNTNSFVGYTFSVTGRHTFELQYKPTIASALDDWQAIKTFDVLVAPGKLAVRPFRKPLVGIQYNSYRQDGSADRQMLWEVDNVGGVDVYITGVRAVQCSGDLSNCSFPDFVPGSGLTVMADQNIILREGFTAKRPSQSPAKDTLSIDMAFSDIYGLESSDIATARAPLEQDLQFNVVASAVSPFTKSGRFSVDGGKDYYVQSCSDSTFSDTSARSDEPLFGITVYDDTGNPVASTNFHEVASCTDADALKHGNSFTDPNNGGALKTFHTGFTGTKTYTYTISGIVGIGGNYRSDFARIGTSFNDTTQLVENLVVDDNLGRQEVIYSQPDPATGYREFKLNAYEGSRQLGKFTPQLATTNTGSITYKLRDVLVNGTSINSTPASSASNAETSIKITADGLVTAVTSAAGPVSTVSFPTSDVNVAWVDQQRYMFESKGKEEGVCRTLQGSIFSSNGTNAVTGPGAGVKLKYDWNPGDINQSFCDPMNPNGSDNPGYVYCDATQFSIELVKKLKGLAALADAGQCGQAKNGLEFYSHLMKDGFTQGFQKDFDYYMRNEFASDPAGYSTDPLHDWNAYFADPKRLSFVNPNIPYPKLYKVTVKPTFDKGYCTFFDEKGSAKATVNVAFTEMDNPVPKNLLYYLPIDGAVGRQAGNTPGMHRNGYGVGFTGNTINIYHSPSANYDLMTQSITQDSRPLVTIDVKSSAGFVTTNTVNPGQLLKITRNPGGGDNAYTMEFTPTVPLPAVMLAEGKGNSISIAYQLFQESTIPVVSRQGIARLIEIGYQKAGQITCTDPTFAVPGLLQPGLTLPALAPNGSADSQAKIPLVNGFDKQLKAISDSFSSANLCTLAPSVSNKDNTYFFSRDNTSDGNIFLETVFYLPAKTSTDILNACSAQGRIFVKNAATPQGYAELKPAASSFTMSSGESYFGTLAEALDSVKQGDTCIVASTEQLGGQLSPKDVGIWWNEGKAASEFAAMVQKKYAPATFCATNK